MRQPLKLDYLWAGLCSSARCISSSVRPDVNDTAGLGPVAAGRRSRLRRDIAFLLAGLAAIVAWDLTGFDLPISRLFGDAHGFAWHDQWFAARVLHDGTRWAAWLLGGLLVVNVWRPLPFRAQRRDRCESGGS